MNELLASTTNKSIDERGFVTRTHVLKYRCSSDVQVDTDTAAGLPGFNWGDPCPFDGQAFLKGGAAEAETTRSPWTYLVTLTFANANVADREQPDDPLQAEHEISGDSQGLARVLGQDINGRPFLNTAKDYFEDPPENQLAIVEFTITRNEPRMNLQLWRAVSNKVNSSNFLGAQRDFLLCRGVTFGQARQGRIRYFKVGYKFAYDDLGWQARKANRGYNELVPVVPNPPAPPGTPQTFKSRPVLDETTKERVTEPAWLDLQGKAIPKSQLPQAAVFLDCENYFRYDFNSLNFRV